MKRPQSKRKRLGALLAVLAGSTLGVGVLASVAVVAPQAGANSSNPSDGGDTNATLQICKAWNDPSYLSTTPGTTPPSFTFNITDGDGSTFSPVTVQAGTCTTPVQVEGGDYLTVTEVGAPWFQVTSITSPGGNDFIQGTPQVDTGTTSSEQLPGKVVVSIPVDKSAILNVTNAPDPGYVEVCKYATAGSGLTGTASYALTQQVQSSTGYTTTATAPVGGCSSPIQVLAGPLTVQEQGATNYLTSITAQYNGVGNPNGAFAPYNPPSNPNLQSGVAVVNVNPSAVTSDQTDVSYTNDVVQVKLCKYWTGGTMPASVPTAGFPFAVSTVAGALSPSTLSNVPSNGMVNVPVGTCDYLGSVAAGTIVNVVENPVAGTKVAGISDTGALSAPATIASPFPPNPSVVGLTNPNTLNGATQIIVGDPTVTTGPEIESQNEALISYTNKPADPGTLKICVNAGSSAPSKSSYDFSVSGVTGMTTVNVGYCSFVLDPTSTTNANFNFPYNSVVTVTGSVASPDATSAIGTVPQYVTQYGGVTTEPTLASSDLKSSTANVVISEHALTEVDFTIGKAPTAPKPPAGGSGQNTAGGGSNTSAGAGSSTSTSTSTSTGGAVGGGGGGGAVGGGGNPVSTPPANNNALPQVTVSPASSPNTTSTGNTSTSSTASAALLAKDQARLVQVRKDIVITRTSLAKYHKLWLTAAHNHWKIRTTLIKVVQHLQARLKALLNLQKSLILAIHKL